MTLSQIFKDGPGDDVETFDSQRVVLPRLLRGQVSSEMPPEPDVD